MRIRNPYTLRLRTSVRKRKHDVKRIFFKNEVRKRNCILGFLKIDVRKLNCILGFLKIDVRKLNCIRIFFSKLMCVNITYTGLNYFEIIFLIIIKYTKLAS